MNNVTHLTSKFRRPFQYNSLPDPDGQTLCDNKWRRRGKKSVFNKFICRVANGQHAGLSNINIIITYWMKPTTASRTWVEQINKSEIQLTHWRVIRHTATTIDKARLQIIWTSPISNEHAVSPCTATLHECHTKQMKKDLNSCPLENWRRPPGRLHIT